MGNLFFFWQPQGTGRADQNGAYKIIWTQWAPCNEQKTVEVLQFVPSSHKTHWIIHRESSNSALLFQGSCEMYLITLFINMLPEIWGQIKLLYQILIWKSCPKALYRWPELFLLVPVCIGENSSSSLSMLVCNLGRQKDRPWEIKDVSRRQASKNWLHSGEKWGEGLFVSPALVFKVIFRSGKSQTNRNYL